MPQRSCLRLPPYILFVCVVFGGLGCNLFTDLDSSPSSVDALLADARTAMTTGEPARALRFLERAHRRDSSHVGVRVELANALFAVEGVDLFVVRGALDAFGSTAEKQTPRIESWRVCSMRGSEPGSSSVRKVTVDGHALTRLEEKEGVLRRVNALLLTGVLERRRDALRDTDVHTEMTAHLLAALTRVGLRLGGVRRSTRETETALYLREDTDPERIVVCGARRREMRTVVKTLERFANGGGQAVTWLRHRNEVAGSHQDSVLINHIEAKVRLIP